jgi:hypothetical protein
MGYLLGGVMGGLIQHTLLHVSSISLVFVTCMHDHGEAVAEDAPHRLRSTQIPLLRANLCCLFLSQHCMRV